MSGYRVLIVGCGQLGSRHLQAIATIPGVREIDVVDEYPAALALGQERIQEIADRQPHIAFRWLSSLSAAERSGDLCIVATLADVRQALVHEIADKLDYKRFLLEKLVTQSSSQYEELLQYSRSKHLSVWVNLKTRAHPSHVHVKRNLNPEESISFVVAGGNHGLANNGVHMADLFAFYDGAASIQLLGQRLDPVLHTSKRGSKLYDLSGTLHGCSDRGSDFTLSFSGKHQGPVLYSITGSRYRAVVDDMSRWIYESTADSGWEWRPVPFEGELTVSRMTRTFAADILKDSACDLPTLEQAFAGHDFIFRSLQPTFGELLKTPLDRCPVT